MTYSFINISTSKFSLNSRELFKTFIAIPVKTNNIKIVNIYDSSSVLIPMTLVSEIEVDGVTYNNSTDLVNAIHDVLFSSSTSGNLDSQQIELNRLAIIDLQNNQTSSNHNHDTRYYTKNEVDGFIANIVSISDLISKGEVDGDVINFRKSDNSIVFSIDAKAFTSQGTLVSFSNGVLTLKNSKGEILSTTNIEAKESYYDKFKYLSGIEDDLSDLIITNPFKLVKTNSGLYFFVSDASNLENFINSKIYLNIIDTFFELSQVTISNSNFNAWQITINNNQFIESENYLFNCWFIIDKIAIDSEKLGGESPSFYATASALDGKANLNGDQLENFSVADATTSFHAINKQQFDTAINALQGSLVPQGNWNADTNTPDITAETETGHYWIVSVEGVTNLGGITDWKVSDWAVKTDTGWAKVDNTLPANVAVNDADNDFTTTQTINANLLIKGTNTLNVSSLPTGGTFDLNSGIRGFLFKNNNGNLLSLSKDGLLGLGIDTPRYNVDIKSDLSDARISLDAATGQDDEIKFLINGNLKATFGYDGTDDIIAFGTSDVNTGVFWQLDLDGNTEQQGNAISKGLIVKNSSVTPNAYKVRVEEKSDNTKSLVYFTANDGTSDINTQLFAYDGTDYKRLATELYVDNKFTSGVDATSLDMSTVATMTFSNGLLIGYTTI